MTRHINYWRIFCSILALLLVMNAVFFSTAAASILSLPTGLKEIGAEAFYGDTNIDHVDVPQGTERIGDYAFMNSSLRTITLPDSVKTIGTDAFPSGVTVYAKPGSDAWNWCIENNISLAYTAPSGVSLDQRGTVTVSVSDPRAHTVMLGVYHRPGTIGRLPRLRASVGASDVSASNISLLAVLPFSVEADSATMTADISSLICDSGSYYVKAKAVSGIAETNAFDLGQGDVIASNEIIYEKPSEAVANPQGVRWDNKVYGRATWEVAEKAVGYQVTLFSGDHVVATRNTNTNYFNFSTEWLDLSDLDEVESKQYRFSVVGLSADIMTISNSEPVYCDSILPNPENKEEVRIVTDPASKYVSLGSQYTVLLSASGIGLTYDWFRHGEQGIAEAIITGSENPFVTLTADETVYVYASVHDAMGNTAESESAEIRVVDDTPIASVIGRQPTACSVDSGYNATFSIGLDLSDRYPYWYDYKVEYQWFRVGDANERVISKENEAVFRASYLDDGTQVYCHVKVTSPTGVVLCEEDSETATLTVRLNLVSLTRDLEEAYYGAGQRNDIYIATRSDTGTTVSYQWLYKPAGADHYSEWPDFNTAFFNTKALTNAHDGMKIKCAITATRDGMTGYLESAEATIHLDHLPATGVEIYRADVAADVDPEHMMVGENVWLKARLTPEYSDSLVSWSSSNPSVAALDNGWVTAKQHGRATITATVDGHRDSYEIHVDRYCVRLNPNNGKFPDGTTEIKIEKPIAGEAIDLPAISRENDTFLGWEKDGVVYSRSYRPTASCVLVAKWESTTEEEDKTLLITQDLASQAYAQIGTETRFEVVSNGAKVFDYQWYYRTGNAEEWIPQNKGTTFDSYRTSLEFESERDHNGWQFKVVLTGKNETVTSNICTLITGEEPTLSDQTNPNIRFVTQPVDTMVKEGDAAVFTAAVNTAADYQWQEKVNGRWEDIANAASGRLELSAVASAMGGKTYRCVVTVGDAVLISSEAKLKVMRLSITKTAGEEYPISGETVTLRCDYEIFGETAQNQEIRWTSGNVQIGSLSENQGSSVTVTIGRTGETDITASVREIEETWHLKVDHVMVTAYAMDGAFDGGAAEKSVRMSPGLKTGEQITAALGTPILASYTFSGWSDTQGGEAMPSITIEEGTTLYAVWKQETVYASSVSIQRNETQPDLAMLVPNDEIHFTAVTVPAETDDDLTWISSNPEVATVNQEGKVTILKTGTATITVQAKNVSDAVNLQINRLKVVLDANGGAFSDGTESHEERVETIGTNLALYAVPAEAPTRAYYQFKGWERDGQAVSGEIVIRGNTALTAAWEGYAPKIITDLAPDYYQGTTAFSVIAEGIDLHYQWQTRMPDNGTWQNVGTNSNTYAAELTADNNGMQIRCIIEDREYSPATTAYSRIGTFHWEVHPESVTIEKVSGPDDLAVGDQIVLQAVIDPENCTDPVSWTSEDENVATVSDGTVTITGLGQTTIKVSVYNKEASYPVAINHAKVTLDANGGTFADGTAKKVVRISTGNYDPMPEFEAPVWDGSEFKGWNTEKAETPLTSINLQSNQTLYAVWERIPVHAESVAIQRAEETPDIHLLVPGDMLHYTAVTVPAETDDTLEWITSNADVATVNNGTVIIHRTGTVTITAKAGNASDSVSLTINHLKVTLNADGGLFDDNREIREEIIGTNSITNKATYTLPTAQPTKEHYHLKGWRQYGELNTVTGDITISNNTTLTAVWDPIKPTIEENLSPAYYADHENGTDTVFTVRASGVDVHYRWQTKMPDDTGWTYVSGNDSTTYAPALDASHDGMQVRCVVEDRWYSPATTAESAIATFYWGNYTVTYDAGEGSFSSGQNTREASVAYGQTYTLEGEEPVRSNYTFEGWEYNGELVTEVVISGNMTVNARWEYEEPNDPLSVFIQTFEVYPYDPDFQLYYDWDGAQYSTDVTGNYVLGTFEFSRPLTEAEESSISTSGSLRNANNEDVYLINYMILMGTLDRDNMYVTYGNEGGVFMIDLTGVDSGTYTFELCCLVDEIWYSNAHEFVYDASIVPGPNPNSLVVTPDFSEITEAYVGDTVTLSVSVNQEDVSYAWIESYPHSSEEILSTESSYTFTANADMDEHYFFCQVSWHGQEEPASTILNIIYPESQRPTSVTITVADDYETINGFEYVKISSAVEGGNGALHYKWQECDQLGDWYSTDSAFESDPTCFYQQSGDGTGHFFRLKVNGVKSNVVYLPYGDESGILISSDWTELNLSPYDPNPQIDIRCSIEISANDEYHWWIKESYQDEYSDELYSEYDPYADVYYVDVSTFPDYWMMYAEMSYDIMLDVNGVLSNILRIDIYRIDEPHGETCPECGGMNGEHSPDCPMGGGGPI